MRLFVLAFVAIAAASSNVDLVHPTCAALMESSREGVRFRVANRCVDAGLVFDFAPTFDGNCWFNTCNGTSDEHWQLANDGSVTASYDNFRAECAHSSGTTVFVLPVDCKTMKPVSAVEELHLQLDVSNGYSIEFRRNWWTINGEVVLEFETQTDRTNKILSIDPDDTVIELLRNSGCTIENGSCMQTWHFLLHDPKVKQFTAHVRSQNGHRVIREKVTFNVEIVDGDVSDWQKEQVIDALLFTSGAMEAPIYPNDKITEGDELCAYAVAPGATGIYAHSAYTCNEQGCFSLAGAQPSSTNTSFFCFKPQKHAAGEQTIEITYEADLPEIPVAQYEKRSWSSTVTTTNGTVIKRRWIVIVACSDDEYWNGERCVDDDDLTDGAFWWLWIAALVAVGVIAACLIAAAYTSDWGYGYSRPHHHRRKPANKQ
jgi:hypothetical protein